MESFIYKDVEINKVWNELKLFKSPGIHLQWGFIATKKVVQKMKNIFQPNYYYHEYILGFALKSTLNN